MSATNGIVIETSALKSPTYQNEEFNVGFDSGIEEGMIRTFRNCMPRLPV